MARKFVNVPIDGLLGVSLRIEVVHVETSPGYWGTKKPYCYMRPVGTSDIWKGGEYESEHEVIDAYQALVQETVAEYSSILFEALMEDGNLTRTLECVLEGVFFEDYDQSCGPHDILAHSDLFAIAMGCYNKVLLQKFGITI